MKSYKFRIAASLAAALTLVLAGCAGLDKVVKPPELSLSNAYITGMSLAEMGVAFDVDVKNPNPLGLSMQGLTYSLQVQDKPAVQGALTQKLDIGANKSSRVQLPFTLRYEDVLGTLLALRDNRELRYEIRGEADFGLLRLPYSKTGTIALPSLPSVSVQRLRVNQFSLSGVNLSVLLQVENANGFPIRLDGLDYQLKLGDAPAIHGAAKAPLAVQANQKGQLELNMSLNYAMIGNLLQTLRSANQLPIEFNSQMKLPGANGQTRLPMDWKGSVPLLR
ncbi:MAG: LEA type 2 family protein [Hylemonella sp.]|nr:LEA type 2 family protein [Hylemonella sp.]